MHSAPGNARDRQMLRFAMNLSLGVGLLMLFIKFGAYLLTGSAAIFADAVETIVHVIAVAFASFSLRLSQKPADASHPYGHAKIGFFSAGAEGALIILAALFIIHDAISKWLAGLVLENIGLGTALTALTVVINGGLGLYLVWLGKRKHSLILEANGKHVLTDAWTSVGVILGLGLTLLTGWLPWDPIFAILVAINILVAGFGLLRRSVGGLMDEADPAIQARLIELLDREVAQRGIAYHALRHRNLGDGHWVDLHLLFSDNTPIKSAHATATEIERAISNAFEAGAIVTTHLEPTADHSRLHRHPESEP
jgi:cation diffusion facilitator family transporter